MSKRSFGITDYPVGYGKPPETSQFQKGQSGNPKGRPKGSKNLASILHRAAHEKITVTENGQKKQITKLEAAAKQLANRAASGDYRALSLLMPQLALVDASLTAPVSPEPDANDQAVMESLVRRFAVHDGDALAFAKPKPTKVRLQKKPT